MHLNEDEKRAVSEFKDSLILQYGERLKLIALFGSKVRGDFSELSDVDLLVVTKDKDTILVREIIGIAFDLMLKYNVYISVKVFDEDQFHYLSSLKTPFMVNIQKESQELWRR